MTLFCVNIRVVGETVCRFHFDHVINITVRCNHIDVATDEGNFVSHNSIDIWEGIEEVSMTAE